MSDEKGIWLRIRKRGHGHSMKNKPRVYFTCHPGDLDRFFDGICDQILKIHDCSVYYTEDMSAPYGVQEWEDDLGQMNLFVIPVTFALLQGGNRALDTDLPFAVKNHIPVLPLMMENGLTEQFTQKFGKVQYLTPGKTDETAISYEEKLEAYLNGVLYGDEIRRRIQAAFDAYIFLSYRKKDRKYANELMRLIHRNPLCRDIAIWYDEFLVPGEDYNENIAHALENSSLFTLLVTPNLLEDRNYIMRVEYPEAKRAEKEILPIEMVQTDPAVMAAKYLDIPVSVRGQDDEEFRTRLMEGLKDIAVLENDTDPVHNFLIGLAYLNGIDVEKNNERAAELITGAAEAGLPEAMEKIAGMYEDGAGVKLDHREEVKWRERLLEWAEKEYKGDEGKLVKYLHNLAYAYVSNGKYRSALSLYERVYGYQKETLGEEAPASLVTLMNIAVTSGKLGNYRKDLEIEKKIYLHRKQKLGAMHPDTLLLLGNIAYLYEALGKYDKSGELDRIVYERYNKIFGENHPDTLLALHNLGVSFSRLGDDLKAVRILEDVYAKRKLVCGEEHPDTLASLSSLAVCYGALGELQKELETEKELYEKRCRILGVEHPATMTTLSNMAVTYGELGDTEKEAELELKVYECRKRELGEEHPETLIALNNLAIAYGNQGDFNRAAKLLEKVYEIRKRTLGDDHPDTLAVKGSLEYAYEKLKGSHQ